MNSKIMILRVVLQTILIEMISLILIAIAFGQL